MSKWRGRSQCRPIDRVALRWVVALFLLAVGGALASGCNGFELDLPGLRHESPLSTVPGHELDVKAHPPLPRSEPQLPEGPAKPKPKPKSPVRTVPLGESVEGRPLVMEIFGRGNRPTFIFGGIHGSEPTSTQLAERLVAHLRATPNLYDDRCVAVLACANPDGLVRRRRGNARGVDLNRNFPAKNFRAAQRHGLTAGSEPETRAIIAAMEMLKPARVVSIHSSRRGMHCNNYDGPAKPLALRMCGCNGYRPLGTWYAATPGSFGTWSGIERQIPTITLELPNDLTGRQCWEENREALLAVIKSDSPPSADLARRPATGQTTPASVTPPAASQ